MDFELKGNVGEITDQLNLLKEVGISINMNDGKFHFENEEEMIKILNLFVKYKVSGYQNYIEDLKKHSSRNYNIRHNGVALLENYNIDRENNIIEIKNRARSFKIIPLDHESGFISYKLEFEDGGEDLDYLFDREIIFFFHADSGLYNVFKKFYDSSKVKQAPIFDIYSQNKKLLFKEVEDGIYMIFNKIVSTKEFVFDEDNSLLIGSPFENELWLEIDKLYSDLNLKFNLRNYR